MPSISIYRPPAARKLEQNANIANLQSSRELTGSSSPVKSKLKTSDDSKGITQTAKRNENNGMSVFRNAITSIREQNKVTKCKNAENAIKRNEIEAKVTKAEENKCTNQSKQRRPDIQVYVPKGRRPVASTNDTKKIDSSVCEEKSYKGSESDVVVVEGEEGGRVESLDGKKAVADTQSEKQSLPNCREAKSLSKAPKTKVTPDSAVNENVQSSPRSSPRGDPDEKSASELKSDLSAVKSSADGETASETKSPPKGPTGPLNPEEDDWETMFDDTGECLDPSLLAQLTSEVGEVTLEKPKSSYNGYKTKSLDTVADEFPHVIEIYNFPPEFQLQDLMMVFSQFKNSGFEIKWVDDTHALGIFSSSAIVSEVLDFYHPFVKTRSLKDGTLLSKMKARRSAEFLLPYKPRPETCSALARRLVTGALGVRLPTSRQEREAEKQIITKARERKRLEAKQKEDAWEGTFS